MPEALRILHDKLPNIDVMVSSRYSPQLADALTKGTVDVAFSPGWEPGRNEIALRLVIDQPRQVIPASHLVAWLWPKVHQSVGSGLVRLAGLCRKTAPVLRAIIDNYLSQSGITDRSGSRGQITSPWVASLIASTRGVGLLPAYTQNFLPRSLTGRPLKGHTPTIDLVLGYKRSNQSPIPSSCFPDWIELVARASNKSR